jgi:hypothetical protein
VSANNTKYSKDDSNLLPGLNEYTCEGTESNLVLVELEAIGIRAFAQCLFFLEIDANFVELGLDVRACRWLSSEARERSGSIGITSAFDQPAG